MRLRPHDGSEDFGLLALLRAVLLIFSVRPAAQNAEVLERDSGSAAAAPKYGV